MTYLNNYQSLSSLIIIQKMRAKTERKRLQKSVQGIQFPAPPHLCPSSVPFQDANDKSQHLPWAPGRMSWHAPWGILRSIQLTPFDPIFEIF